LVISEKVLFQEYPLSEDAESIVPPQQKEDKALKQEEKSETIKK
jgi:hypothetical protein